MNTWIMPCNVSIFNIVEHFEVEDEMYWLGTQATDVGDIIYLYVGKPFSEIKYKCEVIDCQIDEQIIQQSNYDVLKKDSKRRKNFIKIKMIQRYPLGIFPFHTLMQHGLVSVQSQMRISSELIKYLQENERGNE